MPATAIPAWSTGSPLFHDHLDTLFDYAPGAILSFDPHDGRGDRRALRADPRSLRGARQRLSRRRLLARHPTSRCRPTACIIARSTNGEGAASAARVRQSRRSSSERRRRHRRAISAAVPGARSRPSATRRRQRVRCRGRATSRRCSGSGKRVVLAAWTAGARERLASAARRPRPRRGRSRIDELRRGARRCRPADAVLAVLGLEHGFETPRSRRHRRAGHPRRPPRAARAARRRKAADVITEATSLSVGDLVVHADHGIGRFVGLKTITALGAPHDCLELDYARRRQALSAGREHRAAVALRLRRDQRRSSTGSAASPGRRARPASRSACARSPAS